MATGRTTPLYCKMQIEDAGGAMRDIPVLEIGGVGITYDEFDVSALQDMVKGYMQGMGNFAITISGPFDTTADATASASGEASKDHMSGSHTVLNDLNGGATPRAFGCYFGIQAHWSTGDPVFGADNCVIVTDYTVDPAKMTYSAKIVHAAGGTMPAWGTSAITAST